MDHFTFKFPENFHHFRVLTNEKSFREKKIPDQDNEMNRIFILISVHFDYLQYTFNLLFTINLSYIQKKILQQIVIYVPRYI